MKLRDVAGELEAALVRLCGKPESVRPCIVVDAQRRGSGIFIQYAGSATRPLILEVCLNVDTREIAGFEEAATEYFGAEVHIDESETFGRWVKECDTVTRAVEQGMHVLRHVLMLGWDTELFIDEIEDRRLTRKELFGRGEK